MNTIIYLALNKISFFEVFPPKSASSSNKCQTSLDGSFRRSITSEYENASLDQQDKTEQKDEEKSINRKVTYTVQQDKATTYPRKKILLETDFPVVELKPKIQLKKSSLPSEQLALDWLQSKGKKGRVSLKTVDTFIS